MSAYISRVYFLEAARRETGGTGLDRVTERLNQFTAAPHAPGGISVLTRATTRTLPGLLGSPVVYWASILQRPK